jgi:MerR family transcriptional regulator, light-induced transcriptional regulator
MDEGIAQRRFCQGFVEYVYNDSVSIAPDSLRIGEFARRVGVGPEVLRAWERRYGLLQPVRSPGGFRLYTSQDAERVARMRRGLAAGLSAAEAARAALQSPRLSDRLLADAASRLLAAIQDYDEAAVHAILDQSFASVSKQSCATSSFPPSPGSASSGNRDPRYQPGALCQQPNPSPAALTRTDVGARQRTARAARLRARRATRHHPALLRAALALLRLRILFLGADTPIATLTEAVETTRPALTVLASFDPDLLEAEASALRSLAGRLPLVLSGPGASDALCTQLGVRRLDGDLIRAAAEIGHTAYD